MFPFQQMRKGKTSKSGFGYFLFLKVSRKRELEPRTVNTHSAVNWNPGEPTYFLFLIPPLCVDSKQAWRHMLSYKTLIINN